MNADEALAYLESLLPQVYLNKLQRSIFQQVWEDRSYLEIAKGSGYGLSHIKQTGSELWQVLSQNLNEKVNKTNVQRVLKHRLSQSRHAPMPSTGQVLVSGAVVPSPALMPQNLWGEPADSAAFWGRTEELNRLEQWIVQERCRLIGIFGMGGIGKTTLSKRLAQQLAARRQGAQPFEFVIWRSLQNPPPISTLLADWVQAIAPTPAFVFPETLEAQIQCLLNALKNHRCLLILDQIEAVLHPRVPEGNVQPGDAGYGKLLAAVRETQHQSCLVLTSCEQPAEFEANEDLGSAVRSLQLPGLPTAAIQQVLSLRGSFFAQEADWHALGAHYLGNPLALKLVGGAIADFFGGNITQFLLFLQRSDCQLTDIRDLLASQFQHLPLLERQILYWLAIHRNPVSLITLQADLMPQPPAIALLEALGFLERRCFLERTNPISTSVASSVANSVANSVPSSISEVGVLFALQPVVLDYVTEQLITEVYRELMEGEIDGGWSSPKRASQPRATFPQASLLLKTHALLNAPILDPIRDHQLQLIVQPLAERLLATVDRHDLDQYLMHLLSSWRGKSKQQAGYLVGNLTSLLQQIRLDLGDRHVA